MTSGRGKVGEEGEPTGRVSVDRGPRSGEKEEATGSRGVLCRREECRLGLGDESGACLVGGTSATKS